MANKPVAVIVELDYKGDYSRFALTVEEFTKEYNQFDSNMPFPTIDGDSYTLKPMVHIWFKIVEINNQEWNTFFTDMSYQLPESDIETNNLAYVSLLKCLSLRDIVAKTIKN